MKHTDIKLDMRYTAKGVWYWTLYCAALLSTRINCLSSNGTNDLNKKSENVQ